MKSNNIDYPLTKLLQIYKLRIDLFGTTAYRRKKERLRSNKKYFDRQKPSEIK